MMSDYLASFKVTLFNPVFLKDACERAIKTALQSAALIMGQSAAGLELLNADVLTVAGFAGGGFILSLATSIASALFAGRISPASLVKDFEEN